MANDKYDPEKDANRDPITGTPGSHPVGTGLGAAGGAAAGALGGAAVGGPVGAVIGGVAGAVAGGLAGKGIAEHVDPTVEDAYWRETYSKRPYYTGEPYEMYQPAYQYGWESYARYPDRKFADVETELRSDWEKGEHGAKLGWDRARNAASDAWHRIERALPGDFDKDGY
jgi:phage tail tape-measure protein